ncbi:MAG: hypothetical protein EOP04_08545 [Proteobacteria bacterium]|nr:MAG: hypothetical protein EOP04_08545 [Pseudomonadota bacterium]
MKNISSFVLVSLLALPACNQPKDLSAKVQEPQANSASGDSGAKDTTKKGDSTKTTLPSKTGDLATGVDQTDDKDKDKDPVDQPEIGLPSPTSGNTESTSDVDIKLLSGTWSNCLTLENSSGEFVEVYDVAAGTYRSEIWNFNNPTCKSTAGDPGKISPPILEYNKVTFEVNSDKSITIKAKLRDQLLTLHKLKVVGDNMEVTETCQQLSQSQVPVCSPASDKFTRKQ